MLPGTLVSEKTGYHHGDLRAHLVAAVRELVEEKGFDGFSIAEACRRAGVSSAAPYKHFKDKQEILVAVAVDGLFRLGDRMEAEAAKVADDGLARVTAMGRAYVGFARDEPGVFRLTFGQVDTEDKREMMRAVGCDTFGILQRAVADCLATTQDDPVCQFRSYMLWSFVHGHASLSMDGKAEISEAPLEEDRLLAEISRRVLLG
ncbi:TetR/AcrR family transcriptional regulator [Sulfitobacter sp. D35]|uniref:TetR/AcrR family transcriptional regulator n=1 Tax=Sulfitobacter sp. D35 TaxID=3083252 RepID=UPI00296FC6C6|nr:TetR/AcrR family transcriptional regulator [Sulfitobacter sp. D35]MDW4496968.1 TetR/AcrR family transcriptional regulator [Sulfitobacter sp. D35]